MCGLKEKMPIYKPKEASEESGPADNLILDLWPSEPRDNKPLLLKPPSLWYFVTTPQQTNTPSLQTKWQYHFLLLFSSPFLNSTADNLPSGFRDGNEVITSRCVGEFSLKYDLGLIHTCSLPLGSLEAQGKAKVYRVLLAEEQSWRGNERRRGPICI